jgi:hypothetical protein
MNERRWVENPFFVLGLVPNAAREEVEREGKKLLGQLELGVSSAKTYRSPMGTHERTAERVRDALVALRDVEQRLVAEQWAQALEATSEGAVSVDSHTASSNEDGYPAAFVAAGFWR